MEEGLRELIGTLRSGDTNLEVYGLILRGLAWQLAVGISLFVQLLVWYCSRVAVEKIKVKEQRINQLLCLQSP